MAASLLRRGRQLVPRLYLLALHVDACPGPVAGVAAQRDAAAWGPLCRGFSAPAAPCQREAAGHAAPPGEATDEPGAARRSSAAAGPQKKLELVAAFTCGQCSTRSVRSFSRVAYERGVVIARCGGCERQHLLADRLGWFGEAGSVEDFLAEKGEAVRKRMDGTLELSEEDLLGWSKPKPA